MIMKIIFIIYFLLLQFISLAFQANNKSIRRQIVIPVTFPDHIRRHFGYFIAQSDAHAVATYRYTDIWANHVNVWHSSEYLKRKEITLVKVPDMKILNNNLAKNCR